MILYHLQYDAEKTNIFKMTRIHHQMKSLCTVDDITFIKS